MNTVLGKIAVGLLALFLVGYIGYQGRPLCLQPLHHQDGGVLLGGGLSLRVKGR